MPVLVTRRAPGAPALSSRLVRSAAERMLHVVKRHGAELSVLLTGDGFIRTLNRTHRGKDKPTDVLSFSQTEGSDGQLPEEIENALLGDVVISLETAARQARRRRHTLLDEVTFLLAHGILHLLGYDHENDEDEAVMNEMTARLVRAAADEAPPERTPRTPRSTRSSRSTPAQRATRARVTSSPKPKKRR
jgi:probable rRNA maturation factor